MKCDIDHLGSQQFVHTLFSIDPGSFLDIITRILLNLYWRFLRCFFRFRLWLMMTHLISTQVLKYPTVELTSATRSVRPLSLSEMSQEVTHSSSSLSFEHPPPPRATRLGRVAENPSFSAGSNRQSLVIGLKYSSWAVLIFAALTRPSLPEKVSLTLPSLH